MKRGELYIFREPGSFASKARPCLIVQSGLAFPAKTFVTVCPITSIIRGLPLVRIPVAPHPENGLKHVSEIEIDLIETLRVVNLGPLIGGVAPGIMRLVDEALRRWLDL